MAQSIITGLASVLLLFWLTPQAPDDGRDRRLARVERVIDGDTFAIETGERIRIRNFDTAELRRYDCAEERALAVSARDYARRLLSGALVRLEITGSDRYGRLVADVSLRNEGGATIDFVTAMVEGGHGARWAYGEEPQPDWCAPST